MDEVDLSLLKVRLLERKTFYFKEKDLAGLIKPGAEGILEKSL